MFIYTPKIFAHESCTANGNFVTPEIILNKNGTDYNLFHRFCPHRMYPLSEPGQIVKDITCQFHSYSWNAAGEPINNDKKLKCGSITKGRSNLLFKNFNEPKHSWVDDLAKETELTYSHSYFGKSQGSWLWFMDVNTDLLHVYKGGIHPFLSSQIELDDVVMDQGDDWILQSHPDGWWCCIFPYNFVEYGKPGKLSINTVIPNNNNNEFEFQWMTQIYYNNNIVTANDKLIFETLEPVFHEDIQAAELQKGPYFPLTKASNRLEDHCVHWGQWYKKNLKL